jgi:hypothetical protein
VTNEQYSTAKKLQADIDTLEDVNYEIMVKHWVAFKTPNGQTECIKSDTLQIDFEEFVHEEIIKLKKEFDEL